MSFDVRSLLRPELAALEDYVPIVPLDVLSERLGRPVESLIKLDGNENPYGPSPRARAALAAHPWPHIYPDPGHLGLRRALAGFLGVDPENILCGAGSDELLDLILRVALRPGEAILDCPPTFGMYRFLAAVNSGRVVRVPRRPDFSLDRPGIEAALAAPDAPRLMFVASPNNPDGSALTREEVDWLLSLPVLVVLDQAYVEFGGFDAAPLAAGRDNLVVLRTFSKWAGLAGLRVGYGIFPPALIRQMWKIKQPYNVNGPALAMAEASLADLDFLNGCIEKMKAERDRLIRELPAAGYLQPYPSQSNFVLCRVAPPRDARTLVKDLAEQHGILLRHFDTPGLSDHIRVSAGTPEQTHHLLEALKSL